MKQVSQTRGEILIADDSQDELKLLAQVLVNAGYVVRSVCSGAMAIWQAIVNPPDLIVLDVRMPGINGLEACRCLKRNPGTASIPVIFLSAAYDPSDMAAGFDAGGVDFIGKPYVDFEVLARIKTHISMAMLAKEILLRSQAASAADHQFGDGAGLSTGVQQEILIVEDTPDSMKLLSDMLKNAGYRVREAPSGELALWSAAKHPPDLILLDVRMPGMNGFDVCRCLKSDPVTEHIPVIFISALANYTDQKNGFSVGAVDYITKPFLENEVMEKIKNYLNLAGGRKSAVGADENLYPNMAENRQCLRELESVFSYSSCAVLSINKSGKITYANPEFIRLTGYDFSDIEHLDAKELFFDQEILRGDPSGALCHAGIARVKIWNGGVLHCPVSVSRLEDIQPGNTGIDCCIVALCDQSASAALPTPTKRFLHDDPAIGDSNQAGIALEISDAITKDELELLYQPEFDLSSGRVVGAEAMLCWNRPNNAPLSQQQFLKMAEETGDIVPIGAWVLASVCTRFGKSRDLVPAGFSVAIRLTSLQFWQDSLIPAIRQALQNSGLPHSFLQLEIAVETLMEDRLQGIANLRNLKAAGVLIRLSVGRFSHAHVEFFSQAQINSIKFDQALFNAVGGFEIKTLVELAHDRGIKVVASGVTDERQYSLVRAYRCDSAQGDWLAPATTDSCFFGRYINAQK